MTCKLSGLFSTGEDFDDEDLLGTDWAAPSASKPANLTATVAPCALLASSVAHREEDKISFQQTSKGSTAICNGMGSENNTQTAAAHGLRQILSSGQLPCLPASSSSRHPPQQSNNQPNLAAQQSCTKKAPQRASEIQDFFDDWDVDLADLDEIDSHMGLGTCVQQTIEAPAPSPQFTVHGTVSSNRNPQPTTVGGTQIVSSLRELSTSSTSGLSSVNLPLRTSSTAPLSSTAARSPLFTRISNLSVFPGLASPPPLSSPVPRQVQGPHHQPQQAWATPGPSPQGRSLFEPISPMPSSVSTLGLSPRPLNTPILTNRLVQLVSASSQLPKKRPRSDSKRPTTRRFPGPAGLLPQQAHSQSLDDIVVSVPQTPAHGAVARSPNQVPSSQAEDEEFSGGPWAVMKAEMGLDERNPLCFLHSHSVVMVLRKAALKQLVKNKVPNMAVLLKSILHTHIDAKAVFKDPTGEIQGTVHRHLLEDRQGELRAGAVLLLKQVSIFSPSHRNHYLNVTPNNLIRIYPPDRVAPPSAVLSPPALEPVLPSPTQTPSFPGALVSHMQLVCDEEEEEARKASKVSTDPRASTRKTFQGTTTPQDPAWDEDDGLDELMGEMLEEPYSHTT
ncbi:homologous recombination OB-fold protein [Lampris incognitus]|uniref:homologous recombination OB-fold protein n=1 Tax=Lampris incognitus TaxID=2546036 RepID=UPI0024B4F8A1|nr:homologous recombination OB-fold protein [Lampris incognitus]